VAKTERSRTIALYALLISANIAAWAWALVAFRAYPVMLGTALLAYGLGLRHAIDADHLAAIDNVTRKLMQDGQRPLGVGFFFSLGHSTVVVVASIGIAATATLLGARFDAFRHFGGTIGTLVSATFLLAIAAMNCFILAAVYRAFRHARTSGHYVEGDVNVMLGNGKFLARIFKPLFGMMKSSWHMYPLGLLFGLGFDTATEIGLLGISAAQASKGMPIWSILVFPALFTAGMSIVDTTDSVLMVHAYGWAYTKPIRKLYYNLTITAASVLVALLVGGIEALGLVREKLSLTGGFWNVIETLTSHFGMLGYLILAVFLGSWVVALLIYRWKQYDLTDAA
jgi:high-affinity nickel-transport protein